MLVYVQFAGKKVLELVSLLCLCMCSKSSYAWNLIKMCKGSFVVMASVNRLRPHT
jgi:hypothetical protein